MASKREYARVNICAYLSGTPQIRDIINHCDLMIEEKWQNWYDYYGNKLKADNNRKIVIIANKTPIKCYRDIGWVLDVRQISLISKKIMISAGVNIKTQKDMFLVWFMGEDDYLRFCVYKNGKWKNVATILSGVNNLVEFFKNKKVDYSEEIQIIYPDFEMGKTWMSSLSDTKELQQSMWDFNNDFSKTILKDIGVTK